MYDLFAKIILIQLMIRYKNLGRSKRQTLHCSWERAYGSERAVRNKPDINSGTAVNGKTIFLAKLGELLSVPNPSLLASTIEHKLEKNKSGTKR